MQNIFITIMETTLKIIIDESVNFHSQNKSPSLWLIHEFLTELWSIMDELLHIKDHCLTFQINKIEVVPRGRVETRKNAFRSAVFK